MRSTENRIMKGLFTLKDAEIQKVQLKIVIFFKKIFLLIDKIPQNLLNMVEVESNSHILE